jgi:hypothetical protein
MKTVMKYIRFEKVETSEIRKTEIWLIKNNKSGDILARIQWNNHWRQYCMFTYSMPCVFSSGCLLDIVTFLEAINKEHKKKG